jgi:hypothetical protein
MSLSIGINLIALLRLNVVTVVAFINKSSIITTIFMYVTCEISLKRDGYLVSQQYKVTLETSFVCSSLQCCGHCLIL